MKHLTYILLALFATCAHAGDDWQEPETGWGIASLSAHALVWSQERDLALRRSRPHVQFGPTYGPGAYPVKQRPGGPSIAHVNVAFAAEAVAGYLIADNLPHPYRKAFLQGATMIEVGYAAHNFRLGVRTNF